MNIVPSIADGDCIACLVRHQRANVKETNCAEHEEGNALAAFLMSVRRRPVGILEANE